MERSTRSRRIAPLAAVAALIALAFATGVVTSASGCRSMQGKIVIREVTGPACTSSVGVCADLRFRGDLDGSATFTATSLQPTADTPTTSVVLFTADTALTTSRGTLRLKDAGALSTTGQENYVDLATVVGGDDRWAGASGQLKIAGRFATATQDGAATYAGKICTS